MLDKALGDDLRHGLGDVILLPTAGHSLGEA